MTDGGLPQTGRNLNVYFMKPISDKGFLPLPAFGSLDKTSFFN
jgi:hypothetical protein